MTEATYHAEVVWLPGTEQNQLSVYDQEGQVVAETTYRPMRGFTGPRSWGVVLLSLGYQAVSPWKPGDDGFSSKCRPL